MSAKPPELAFLNGLSHEQIVYAHTIALAAEKAGVPPKLAVAIAYQESRLNPNAPNGADGEIGGMQVKPSTAKGEGFSLSDIKTPQGNIDAGIAYLKRSWELNKKNPKLTAYGYNRGIDDPLFYGGEANPSGQDYVTAIAKHGAFKGLVQETPVEEAPAASKAPSLAASEATLPADDTEAKPPRSTVGPAPPDSDTPPDTSGAPKSERVFYGGVGAASGALVPGSKFVKNALKEGAISLAESTGAATERGRLAAQAADEATKVGKVVPPSVTPPSSLAKIEPINMSLAGGQGATSDLTKATGRGSAVFNYGTKYGLGDIEAGRALSTKKEKGGVWDLLAKRQDSINRINELFPSGNFVENQQYGGLMTPEGKPPKASFKVQGPTPPSDLPPNYMPGPAAPPPQGTLVQLPKQAPPAPLSMTQTAKQKAAAGLDAITGFYKSKLIPVAATVAKVAGPPAAGMFAGLDLAEGIHEYQKPEDQRDYIKMGTKGVGALGGVMSMFPGGARYGVPMMLGAAGLDAYRDPEKRAYIEKMMQDAQRGVMSNVGVPFEFGPAP